MEGLIAVAYERGSEAATDGSARSLVGTAAVTVPGDDASWVEPDYLSLLSDTELAGPAMLMPAGLLPDGRPHSGDDMDNAERISGCRPRSAAEADTTVVAYLAQQAALRTAAGLPPARRDRSGQLVEDPAVVAAIRELHRQERARRRLIETPPAIGETLDGLAQALVGSADQVLRELGMCPAPTVYMLCKDMEQPYAGMLTCRPFYRGTDAADAVAAMGALPAALWATHLLVVWEHSDLCTALELPGEAFPSGIVVLEATMSEHTVRWYPYLTRFGAVGASGLPTVLPDWGTPTRHPGAKLPDPIIRLLASWRDWTETDNLAQQAADLERAGYRMRWAARS